MFFLEPDSFFTDNNTNLRIYSDFLTYLAGKLDQHEINSEEYIRVFNEEIHPTLNAIPFLESVNVEYDGIV
ncbi:MAG: hypothetical protein ABII18_02960 [bacterium]|nr:hypothetical protein [bacterium]MBU1917314.1 hypothetical protein [bacterium]